MINSVSIDLYLKTKQYKRVLITEKLLDAKLKKDYFGTKSNQT